MKTKSLVTFGLSVGLLLPFLMMTAGHYPRYYAWMTFLPVTIATVGVWDAWLRSSHSRLLRWGSGAMLAMACAMGLPARVALTAMEWDSRDYGRIERIVQPQVRADDWAVIDYSAYYAVKPIAQWTFLPPYLARITEQERSRVSLLVIHPEDFASVSMRIGGQWTEAASVQSESPAMAFWLRRHVGAEMYSLAVYRRASESPH